MRMEAEANRAIDTTGNSKILLEKQRTDAMKGRM